MSGAEALLEAKQLTIGYRLKGGREKVLASKLSLALRSGELVCLLGPNGVGKSTLIRALAGLESPLSGRIDLMGKDTRFLSPRDRARMTSVVLTENAPVGLLSVRAMVALGRHPHTRWTGRLADGDRDRVEWAMRTVGIESLSERAVDELSDGERQKVMVARALAQDSAAMLLDEPTAFVDLPRRVELMRLLGQLAHEQGMAVLLSSHDLELCLRCADRLWLMGEDGPLSEGSPEGLALSGELERAFANEALGWDVETGGFRMHRIFERRAILRGSGETVLWTRRALHRLGFDVCDSGPADLEVEVESDARSTVWNLRSGAKEARFRTLDSALDWAKTVFEEK